MKYLFLLLVLTACAKENITELSPEEQEIARKNLAFRDNIISNYYNPPIENKEISTTDQVFQSMPYTDTLKWEEDWPAPEILIQGLQKGDLSVLKFFFETNQLFPYIIVRDKGFTVDMYTNTATGRIKIEPSTNWTIFANKGAAIISTNRFGIPFIESQKLLIDLKVLTNLRKDTCTGYELIIDRIAQAKTIDDIYTYDNELGDPSYTIYTYAALPRRIQDILEKYSNVALNREFIKLEQQFQKAWQLFDTAQSDGGFSKTISPVLKNSHLYMYLMNKVSGATLESKKIEVLNYHFASLFSQDKNNLQLSPTPTWDASDAECD